MGTFTCGPDATLSRLGRREKEDVSGDDTESMAVHLTRVSGLNHWSDLLLCLEMLL
jgi:hypothetical protein